MTNIDLHDIPEDRIKQFERHVDISVYYKTSDSLSFRGGEIDYHGNDHYDTLFTATIQWIAPELDPAAALDIVLAKVPYESDEELYLELLLWAEEVEYDKEKFREKIHVKYPPSKNQIVHTIETPKGTIAIEDKQDPTYPGVYILINGAAIAMVEYDSPDERHAIRVWNADDHENDAEYIQTIPNDFPKTKEEN